MTSIKTLSSLTPLPRDLLPTSRPKRLLHLCCPCLHSLPLFLYHLDPLILSCFFVFCFSVLPKYESVQQSSLKADQAIQNQEPKKPSLFDGTNRDKIVSLWNHRHACFLQMFEKHFQKASFHLSPCSKDCLPHEKCSMSLKKAIALYPSNFFYVPSNLFNKHFVLGYQDEQFL